MGLRQEILRQLVTEYQESRDPKLLLKILERVDDLVIYVIAKYVKQHPQLKEVEPQDLYQTAILGVERAISTTKEHESGDTVVGRILVYIKLNIHKTYEKKTIADFWKKVPIDFLGKCISKEDYFSEVELRFYHDKFVDIIVQGTISIKEFNLLARKFAKGESYRSIGREEGVTGEAIRRRVKIILKKLRFVFRNELGDY